MREYWKKEVVLCERVVELGLSCVRGFEIALLAGLKAHRVPAGAQWHGCLDFCFRGVGHGSPLPRSPPPAPKRAPVMGPSKPTQKYLGFNGRGERGGGGPRGQSGGGGDGGGGGGR